jgi:hypothetical protein
MKGSIAAFYSELSRLQEYISRSELEAELLKSIASSGGDFAEDKRELIRKIALGTTNNRRYGYFLAVIIMYGALERLVDEGVQEYLNNILKIGGDISALPILIQDAHVPLSIEQLHLIQLGRIPDKTDIPAIIKNLTSDGISGSSRQLNTKAFTLRSGNMTFDRIKSIFKNAGIILDGKRLASTAKFDEEYRKLFGVDLDPDSPTAVDKVPKRIDDLVGLRNLVAHGVIDTDQIEDGDLINQRIGELKTFASALAKIVEQETLLYAASIGKLTALSPLIAVYNNSIVCCELNDGQLAVGNLIVMPSSSPAEPIRYGRILSLQVDKVLAEVVQGVLGLKVGMKVDFYARPGGIYYQVPENVAALISSAS